MLTVLLPMISLCKRLTRRHTIVFARLGSLAIGVEYTEGIAFVEVTADGFPLTDLVSGRSKSERGMIQFAWTQSGERQIRVVSRNAANQIVGTETRTLHVR